MNFNDEDYAYIVKNNYRIDVRDRIHPVLIHGNYWARKFPSMVEAIEHALVQIAISEKGWEAVTEVY